jgi:low temperature requirement protein LtrA
VILYALLATTGLLAVLAGAFLDPSLRQGLWLGVIALDLGAGWISGNRRPAGIHPGHFAERHGLIVIIALGESLIVATSGLSADIRLSMAAIGGIALVITCLLWWTYFGWIKDVLEERLADLDPYDRALLARDAYTFWHFPLLSGIIALAVGFEASLHPDDYTAVQAAAAMGVGLTLFLVSTAAALWRAKRCVLWNRLIILVLTLGGLAYSVSASIRQGLSVTAAGLSVIVIVEQITTRRKLARR